MATLLLRCGCSVPFSEERPTCGTHGPQVVVRVIGLRPPTFRGVATGPHVTTMDLAPHIGPLPGVEQETAS